MRHLDGPDRLAAGERLVNSGNTILISHRRPSELSIVSPELSRNSRGTLGTLPPELFRNSSGAERQGISLTMGVSGWRGSASHTARPG